MKRRIIFTLLLIMIGGLSSFSQCPCAATDYASINVSGWVVGQTGTITTCQYGGERSTINNTVNGAVYLVSSCGAGFDTQLSIYTTSCVFVAYNDDNGPACTGTAASVQFTSPGGNLYSVLSRYNCTTQNTCMTVTIQLISLPIPFNTVPFSGNNSYTVCAGNLYDHGGPSGDYLVNANGYTVLYPSVAGNAIQISGTSSGESCCDYIEVYNGAGLGGTLLGTYYLNTAIPILTSTDPTGALTVRFYSDYSIVGAGFDIAITCVIPPMTVPFLGNNSYTVCVGNLYDHGGVGGNYANSASGYTVLYPSVLGNKIRVSGNLTSEANYDYLRIYNGVGLGGTLLWSGSGTVPIPLTTSTDPIGALTVNFYSDASIVYAGFDIAIGCYDPLPISLLSFTGTCNGNAVTLNWSTASEVNNDYFTIAKSVDAVNWSTVKIVEGAGNSNRMRNYTITDEAADNIYYRLTQTDFDGKYETFPLISVSCPASASTVSIHPNPTSDILYIEAGSAMIEYQLFNSDGQEVTAGSAKVIDMTKFAAGLYFIKISTDEKIYFRRFIKN